MTAGKSGTLNFHCMIVSKETKQMMSAKLIEASSNGWIREVWALLVGGANKDARDGKGNTALHLAAANGHAKVVKFLLAQGLEVNAVNSSRQTPLHMAAQRGDTNIIWMLVAASAQIDAQDNQGQTPLHVAAQKSQFCSKCSDTDCYSHPPNNGIDPVVIVLLLAGARKDVKNLSNKTPIGVATPSTRNAFNVYSDLL